jgi:hypothetical protein
LSTLDKQKKRRISILSTNRNVFTFSFLLKSADKYFSNNSLNLIAKDSFSSIFLFENSLSKSKKAEVRGVSPDLPLGASLK